MRAPDLRGVSVEDVTRTILSYLDNTVIERANGIQRRDGGPHMAICSFLRKWSEANRSEEAERLKAIIDKHFGTALAKK